MATTTGIKFYSKAFEAGAAATLSTNTAGAIVFDKTAKAIYVNGIEYGGSKVKDATFSSGILTITKEGSNQQIQLDFNTLATTESIMNAFKTLHDEIDAIETGAGLGENGAYTADSTTNYLTEATSLKDADKKLDAQLKTVANAVDNLTSGTVTDVKINNTSVKKNTVADIAVDGTYDDTTNKIATKSTVTNAINALDTTNDVQAVDYTAADTTNGAKLTFKGVSETDGIIAQGTGLVELQFGKIATTGAAADVSIADSGNLFTATTVEGALAEIAGEIDGMDLTATALMTQTDDTTNGNSTFTISGIQEADGVVSLASGNNTSFKTDGVYNASSNLIATQSTVTTAIQNALDSEVTFQGVTSTLPSTPTNGDMYKASGAITIPAASAGEGAEITTKAGDTIIYKNITGAQNNGWYVIPSADDVEDTWRKIKVNGTDALGNGTSTGDVNFVNGTLTTVSAESNGAISINHATPAAGTGTNAALKFQLDSYGHVVGTDALTIGDLGGLSSITHGTDGSYVTLSVGSKSNNSQEISASLTIQGMSTADSTHMGLAEASDVKDYVDRKVGTAVQSVDGSTAENEKSVTQGSYAAVKVTATTDNSNNVTLDSAVALTIQPMSSAAATTAMGLAEASDVKSYVDTHTAVTNSAPTIAVNDTTASTIATVNGTAVTAKVALTWDEWE